MTIRPFFKLTLTAASLTFATAASAANGWEGTWGNNDNILDPGTSIQSLAANSNKNSYTSNPALTSNAWGMQGTWLSFQVPSATNVLISLTSAKNNAPGFTLYRTNGAFTGNGTGTTTGTNGAIHSFNQVAQAGTAGIVWATDSSVTTSLPGNTTANGIVETLGYVNGSNVNYLNSYGARVDAGAHDVSIDNLYENGIFGNITEVGGLNYSNLTVINLMPGYYTIFLGGTNTGGTGVPIDVKVSAISATPMDCLFDWAETSYPALFTPSGSASKVDATSIFYYRGYPQMQAYLGISKWDNHVWFSGSDNVMKDQGASSAWLTVAGCN